MDNKQLIMKPALQALLQSAWQQYRIILISAPCGFGKTTVANLMLKQHHVDTYRLNGQELCIEPILPNCDAILIDELQLVKDSTDQQTICEWIKTNPDKHFVFLSRGPVPGWLMPFQFSGMMMLVDSKALLFDRSTIARYLEQNNIVVSQQELISIHSESIGYPLGLAILCDCMVDGVPFSATIADKVRRRLFVLYEETIYRTFDLSTRQMLLNLAPFEPITLELAKILNGNSHVGELLGQIQRDSTMLIFDGLDSFRLWPEFRKFLLWEMQQQYTLIEQHTLYNRAALYYELQEDYGKALDCYSHSGEHRKVMELLIKNAEQHPGVGHYYDMEKYYYAMPR